MLIAMSIYFQNYQSKLSISLPYIMNAYGNSINEHILLLCDFIYHIWEYIDERKRSSTCDKKLLCHFVKKKIRFERRLILQLVGRRLA